MNSTTLFLIATSIWGSTWLSITYQLGVVPPEVSVAYRFALAALMVAAWCKATGASLRFPLREHRYLAGFGITLFGLNYVAVYWAERFIPSGLAAVLFSTIVFMSAIGMRLAFGTPLTARTLAAATLGVTGVALLFLPELRAARHGGNAAMGVAFALGATLIATIGNVVAVRNHRAGLPTLPATAWGMAYGALAAALVATLTGVRWTFDPRAAYVLSLLYLTVFGSVFAFAAYLTLLKRVGAGPASFVGVATPVIALLLSTLVEGYRWTGVAALGVVLAVVGNWMALRPARSDGMPPSSADANAHTATDSAVTRTAGSRR
jgi:drug/metabolite transporter (DMT)-like permease